MLPPRPPQELMASATSASQDLYWWRPPALRPAAPRYPWRRKPTPPTLAAVAPGTTLVEQHPVSEHGETPRAGRTVLFVALASAYAAWAGVAAVPAMALGLWLAFIAPTRGLRRCAQRLRRALARRLAAGRLERPPLEIAPLSGSEGDWVRVRARVVEGQGFETVDGHRGAILVRYAGAFGEEGRSHYFQAEVHAVPSCMVVVGNDLVELDLRQADFLPTPNDPDWLHGPCLGSRAVALPYGPSVSAQVHDAEVIKAGEEIEVLGRLTRAIDPKRASTFRTPALKLVLSGDDHHRLVLRKR